MVLWEIPALAASRLTSVSHALKSPPQGAATDGAENDGSENAMQISAIPIKGNGVRALRIMGLSIKLPMDDRARNLAGLPLRVRVGFQPPFL
jgi:hypothetical protein